MRKICALLFMIFILVNINFLNIVFAEDINPISSASPIRETFDKKIIIWDFDDFRITDAYSTRGVKFIAMTENVTKHGGYVGWGFIPGANETIAYPSPQNLTYTKHNVDRMKVITSDSHIFLFYHDWNHTWYLEGHESPWLQNLSFQRYVMNYTIWTFYNNFGYNLTYFLGGGSNVNHNTTVVLAESKILLIYGGIKATEVAKGCRYIHLPGDKIIGLSYLGPPLVIDSWKENFTKLFEKYTIIRIGSHPFDFNETSLTEWAEFTKWVYTNHDLINMNYTDAYNYKHDLESIKLDKFNDTSYMLNFTDAFDPMNITWSESGDWIVRYADNQTRYGDINVTSHSDTILLQPGYDYTIRLASSINKNHNNQTPFPGIGIILLIFAIAIYIASKKR